jgi:ATP-dependent DNA ligase
MSAILSILYARGNNGKVLEFEIEVVGNRFRTITGAQGFGHVTTDWTTCEGKNIGRSNETTPEEQAFLEAKSKWEKKQKSGGYWKSIKDIDTLKFIEPMLAYPLINSKRDRTDRVKFPCMVDRKYNGHRVVITKNGAFTRTGERYSIIPHIVKALVPLFEKYPDLVLDGEGYNHLYRYKLCELNKILRTTVNITDEILARSESLVRLYVYDGYGFDNITEETGNLERRTALKKLLDGVEYAVWVPFQVAKTLTEIYTIYTEYIEEGYEGAMVRNSDATYQHKRTNDLLKVKPENDDEAIILSIHKGVGNASNFAAKASVRMADGREFNATFKGPQDQKMEILKHPENWIGKEVTFLYNDVTGYNIPNFARIDIDNCFKK